MIIKVTSLVSLYSIIFPGDPVLRLNDASLERGGLFDIKASQGESWVPPHGTHRRGDIIDIRFNPNYNPDTAIPEVNRTKFTKLVRSIGGRARVHSPGTSNQHFHVKF